MRRWRFACGSELGAASRGAPAATAAAAAAVGGTREGSNAAMPSSTSRILWWQWDWKHAGYEAEAGRRGEGGKHMRLGRGWDKCLEGGGGLFTKDGGG